MKLLNFGSLNIDYVYKVDHFVRPGETLLSENLSTFAGGKGLNQSIALAKAGANVWHAGKIGRDGLFLLDTLKDNRVNTSFIELAEGTTGHAIIQVDTSGQNCILLYGGQNQNITSEDIDKVMSNFTDGDIVLLQNEINNIDYIISKAHGLGAKIIMNPAPMNKSVHNYPLELVDTFIVNEIEGADLSGEKEIEKVVDKMLLLNPKGHLVITLGEKGVLYADRDKKISHGIYDVEVKDTTAAGDTFTGYYLAAILEGKSVEEALELGSKASAICVSRHGAADSIPIREEVENVNLKLKT